MSCDFPIIQDYKKALEKFNKAKKKGYDSLITVNRFKGFLLNEKLYPVNYNWGDGMTTRKICQNIIM